MGERAPVTGLTIIQILNIFASETCNLVNVQMLVISILLFLSDEWNYWNAIIGTLYCKNQNKCYLNVEKTALAMTTLLTLTTSKLFSSSSDISAKSSKYSYIFTPVTFSGGEVVGFTWDLTGVEVMYGLLLSV